MKRLAPVILLTLAACASQPDDVFQSTTPHQQVGWSLQERADGSLYSCPIWQLENGTEIWCGPHRIGDGPDIYDESGNAAVYVNLEDE